MSDPEKEENTKTECRQENIRVAYQMAVSLKNSENDAFWSKVNTLILANSFIVAGIATVWNPADISRLGLTIVLGIFGVLLNCLGRRLVLRSEIWHKHWLDRAKKLEGELPGLFQKLLTAPTESALKEDPTNKSLAHFLVQILIGFHVFIIVLTVALGFYYRSCYA